MTTDIAALLAGLAQSIPLDSTLAGIVADLDRMKLHIAGLAAREDSLDVVGPLHRLSLTLYALQREAVHQRNVHMDKLRPTTSNGELARLTGMSRVSVVHTLTKRRTDTKFRTVEPPARSVKRKTGAVARSRVRGDSPRAQPKPRTSPS